MQNMKWYIGKLHTKYSVFIPVKLNSFKNAVLLLKFTNKQQKLKAISWLKNKV